VAKSHFAGVIIWRTGPDGIEYLVIEYDSGDGVQIKFPGGTNNDHPGEPLFGKEGTFSREGTGETGLVIPDDLSERDVIYVSRPDPNHTKHFVIVPFERCRGELRTSPKRDGGDMLSPPFWRTAGELLVPVENGGLFWTHRKALEAAERRLSQAVRP